MIVSCFSLTIYLFSIGRTMGVNFLQPDTRRCVSRTSWASDVPLSSTSLGSIKLLSNPVV